MINAAETQLTNWERISTNYDTFFVDMVGVIYDGINPFPKAIEALNNIKNSKNLIFISNTPRPSELSIERLKTFNIKRDYKIITSGDFSRHILKMNNYKNLIYYHWGMERNSDLLENLEIKLTKDINQADCVLLSVFLEEEEMKEKYNDLIELIVKKNIPVYCTNPDKKALFGNSTRICAGYFADIISQKGGNIHFWGKPNKDIFCYAQEIYPDFVSQKSKCIMIGDTIETDIKGATRFGIDSLLVLTGISAMEKTPYDISCDIKPTYVMECLSIS